jgi:2-polyprenyl-3-methyl-5-hydroxy-6-metoxy-1,4-benzoquinol methylase
MIEAIDISAGMLEFVQQQANENAITNVNSRQISIFDQQLNEESFDVIIAFNVLHYMNDTPALMLRLNSLLKPNGVFISSTACLKEKKRLVRFAVYPFMKLGLIPQIKFYKTSHLNF